MINRNLAIALISAGSYIAGALALKAAEKAGLMSHADTVRAFQVFSGVGLAVYANFLPKSLGRFRDPAAAMRMEAVLRVSGWAYMLGGVGYAVTSLLPLPLEVSVAVLGSATAYAVGYAAFAFSPWPRRHA
jgi:hypothetical protein